MLGLAQLRYSPNPPHCRNQNQNRYFTGFTSRFYENLAKKVTFEPLRTSRRHVSCNKQWGSRLHLKYNQVDPLCAGGGGGADGGGIGGGDGGLWWGTGDDHEGNSDDYSSSKSWSWWDRYGPLVDCIVKGLVAVSVSIMGLNLSFGTLFVMWILDLWSPSQLFQKQPLIRFPLLAKQITIGLSLVLMVGLALLGSDHSLWIPCSRLFVFMITLLGLQFL